MTRPPVDVRQSRPDDVDELLALWVQARAELGGAGRPLLGSTPDVIRPRLVDALTRRDGLHILLARHEGRPAGFAVVRIGQLMPVLEGECVQLEHLYVTAPLRRQGVARALLAGVATLAERHGADQILGGAPPSAREMHRFLARLGFTPLVLRRVASTATLRRRLAGESRRSALEDLLSRRRSSRARSNRLATPPGGLTLTPVAPAGDRGDAGVVDLPAVERPAVAPQVVELPLDAPAGLPADLAVELARPLAVVEGCAPQDAPVPAIGVQRVRRPRRAPAATAAAGATGPDGDAPGPAA